MKLASWNVNGIRACATKGFLQWMENENADVVCLQEIKATPEQLDDTLRNPLGYHAVWNPAQKPGYSGVSIFSKKEPLEVGLGLGKAKFDSEGRVLWAEFKDFILITAYFPNSQRDHARLGYKLDFCEEILKSCLALVNRGKNVVLCGDYNIAHEPIDLKNPKTNEKNAGYLPEERAWMTRFLQSGFADPFRRMNSEPDHYTWWSYRPGVREKNIGWRLDYHCVNEALMNRVKNVVHRPTVMGSDHCPVLLELRN